MGLAARQKESPVLKHLEPNPAKPTAVASASAQGVVAGMMLTPGFQAELIAAEPDVRQPVAFIGLCRAGLPCNLYGQRIEHTARRAAGNHRPHHLRELPRIDFTERPA